MNVGMLFIVTFFAFKLSASITEIKGILFIPLVFNQLAEVDPVHNKILIKVYESPSTSSAVVATISRRGIFQTSGKSLNVPEFTYEERALPVIEQKDGWYKVGFSNQVPEGFSEDFSVAGWVSYKHSRYQPISDFMKDSMISLIDWDQVLYKEPGAKEKFRVEFSQLNILGTARTKPEILKKTKSPCEVLFYSDSASQNSVGICPQNFTFIHGENCNNQSEIQKDSSNIFCRKLFILDQTESLYKVAFKNESLPYITKKGITNLLKVQPNFDFYTGWVKKDSFESIIPISTVAMITAQYSILGRELPKHNGVEVEEFKTIENQDWVKLKIKDHCSEEKIYGQGWVPLRKNRKINFSFHSRGC